MTAAGSEPHDPYPVRCAVSIEIANGLPRRAELGPARDGAAQVAGRGPGRPHPDAILYTAVAMLGLGLPVALAVSGMVRTRLAQRVAR